MKLRMIVVATAIACSASWPAGAMAQQQRDAGFEVGDVLRPAAWGGLAGIGLAVAYVNPDGGAWLFRDEVAGPLAVLTGVGTAFLVQRGSAGLDPADSRRPRLRVAVGGGGAMDWDYSLAYRTPRGDRYALEIAVVVVNDTWEKVERQIRCAGFLGCLEGDFVTDHRYQQGVAWLARGVYELRPESPWNPTVTVGAGPAGIHMFAEATNAVGRTGLLLDTAVGVERGTRRQLTAETGLRIMPIGGRRTVDIDDATWYARIGWAWGG